MSDMNAMEANRSVYNPTDMAAMAKSGRISPNQTFGQFMESTFGIKWDDPMQVASQKLQQNLKNSNPVTKMQNMAQQPAPQGAPEQNAPMPRQPGSGLSGIMGQME